MKTKHSLAVLVLLFLFTKSVFAQTLNQSYELPGWNLGGGKVVPGYDGRTMFFIADVLDPTNPGYQPNQLLLTKTDLNGNIQKSILIDTTLYNHKMIETSDSGVLIAANPFNVANPPYDCPLFILKFDKNLNLQWTLTYGFSGFYPNGIDQAEVAIQKIPARNDTIPEEYIIVYNSQSFKDEPYRTNDLAFSAIRVNRSGVVKWHHRYTDMNREYNPATFVLDRINSITMLPDTGDTTHKKKLVCSFRKQVGGSNSWYGYNEDIFDDH